MVGGYRYFVAVSARLSEEEAFKIALKPNSPAKLFVGYYDGAWNITVLSRTLKTALKLAKKSNQKSIYDWVKEKEVFVDAENR
jgi:hypothetical protein